MSSFDFEKFRAGIRHIGVGLALSGIVGLFFGQLTLPSIAAAAAGVALLAVGSTFSSEGA